MTTLTAPAPLRTAASAETPDYELLAAAEDRHFWFHARNRLIEAVVRSLVADWSAGYRVLEVGCGTGNVLRVLESACPRGKVTGLDCFPDGLPYARQRTACPLLQAEIEQLPFGPVFQLVGMFDVLEHIADDDAALRQLHAVLRPGGRIVLTVPAYMSLWSHTDEYAQHHRRYAPAELGSVLAHNGFRVDYLTPFMLALAPVMWLSRRLARRRTASRRDLFAQELTIRPGINGLARRALEWESAVIQRRWRLPVGASLLAIATRV